MKNITDKFQNLDHDKQQRILDAAFQEFAENGYERASTNQIVKNAQIGKGMLFYYFQSKQELYHYLVEYALKIIRDQYLNLIDMNETDFIERMRLATQVKMTCFAENPSLFNFLGTFFLESKPDLPPYLAQHYEQLLADGYAIMYENIDKTLFRDDIDVEKVFKLIQWAMDGYQNEVVSRLKDQKLSSVDFNPYWEAFYAYLDILKKSFYK
ncbi:TetR/AcrR family transcriptional regulator [Lentibacillus sp.]|uniref:TetR/AcrR family transcriptional regulator n=1 Tax=Lentibacillus sp. TaxID=1925746 RepID=UPI002B4AB816|nr:TetR/AcrR family transcriptional regulator [Lentibacillus sp.]HLS09513.1 TetR/AcrR family transcriptional regulator [Lentibacillus sp.]